MTVYEVLLAKIFCVFTICLVAGYLYSLWHKNKLPRLFGLIVFNVTLIGVLIAIAPQQVPLTLYKLSLVTLAGLVGYWLDRALFPYARPDQFIDSDNCQQEGEGIYPLVTVVVDEFVFSACMIRRALIVGCAMLAMGLGA